ncbi:hypothetical protein ACFXJ8_11870 [Nonomuraea sp. NPDC059194]|uniref:DUF7426 family protein n=1 Tax=Nonomuraea sp. NPDC059194 TaxID=3346764 RepID=UPI0036C0B035
MPRFPELDASLGETLDLPVPLPAGQVKEYKVPPVDADTWTWLTARFAASSDDDVLDDETETGLYRRCLGPVYDQLKTDKAGWEQIRRCGLAALAWHVHGEQAALKVWEGGLPKQRSKSETGEPTETQAEAPSTPPPGSESGTTPTLRKAQGSRGRTSSTAGTSSKSTSTKRTASTSADPVS